MAGLVVLGGPGAASAARPDATIMGFGFRSFRSPGVHKPMPSGSVKPGGALRGCRHRFHAYVGYPFGNSLPLDGHYILTVKIAGRKVAAGGVTIVSTCG